MFIVEPTNTMKVANSKEMLCPILPLPVVNPIIPSIIKGDRKINPRIDINHTEYSL